MATVAQPPGNGRPPGNQKKIFRSISKFLSGGKTRSKLPDGPSNKPPKPSPPLGAAGGSDVRLATQNNSPRTTGQSTLDSRRDADGASYAESGLSTGADTSASVQAMAPHSTAPSILSRTTSAEGSTAPSFMGTYKSDTSTKQTTLLSIDSAGGGGANRIAVVPGTGQSHFAVGGMPASGSGGSLSAQAGGSSSTSPNPITFSALPPSVPLSPRNPGSPAPDTPTIYPEADALNHDDDDDDDARSSDTENDGAHEGGLSAANVPRHTRAHPRNNPHPAYPPTDNASMLTLASSSFAPSFTLARPSGGGGGGGGGGGSVPGSGGWSGGGLSGLRAWKDRGDGASSIGGGTMGDRADEDASVRALAGSRRASDESLGAKSTWSAAVLLNSGASVSGLGTSSGRTASVKTKGTTGTNDTGGEEETEAQKVVRHEGGKEAAKEALAAGAQPISHVAPVGEAIQEHDATPTEEKAVDDALSNGAEVPESTPPVGSVASESNAELAKGAESEAEGAKTPQGIDAQSSVDLTTAHETVAPVSAAAEGPEILVDEAEAKKEE